MIRTQVQFTTAQAERLKQLATTQRKSVAELVREGVDRLLSEPTAARRGDRMRRAAAVFGTFRSGAGDLATRHDAHFAEAAGRRR
jgi:hypothetical protein